MDTSVFPGGSNKTLNFASVRTSQAGEYVCQASVNSTELPGVAELSEEIELFVRSKKHKCTNESL